jgi:hypothetical protein
MENWYDLISLVMATASNLLPILLFFVFFQVVVLKQSPTSLGRICVGLGLMAVGMVCLVGGLDMALFPIGKNLAFQLARETQNGVGTSWVNYAWIYLFSFTLGFSTTIAEPTLITIADKVQEVSRRAIPSLGLRVAAALGVAIGITLGCFRIVTGASLFGFIFAGYAVVIVQTFTAPRMIVSLAYDLGGVSTSTITVPMVVALGLGLSSNIPGRSPFLDGFGLIALACLFPVISVLGYAQLAQWMAGKRRS